MDNTPIVWSHSRINTLINNPAEYYLSYVEGIIPKQEKTALSIGSAIHWGLEHEQSDLTDYYNDKGSFNQWNNYTEEQCLAETIVENFLNRKEEIYHKILCDEETGEELEILETFKELKLTAHLDSETFTEGHDFLGIIDLLLLTNKGFVLLDYKTSSRDVNWDSYKSQLYKYSILLNYNFPNIDLYKVGIINLKKTQIRRRKDENDFSFKRRIKEVYMIDDSLIDYHYYMSSEFSKEEIESFKRDLSLMLDVGQNIVNTGKYYINYSNITNQYGDSQYYDIFYKTESSQYKYAIRDTIFDEDTDKLLDIRDCDKIDMLVLTNHNVLNKYQLFKQEVSKMFEIDKNINEAKIFENLKKNYICSDDLLKKYFYTYNKNI